MSSLPVSGAAPRDIDLATVKAGRTEPWSRDEIYGDTDSPASLREQTRLSNQLHAAFEADPLEDGMSHPAEKILAEALRFRGDRPVLEWLRYFSLDAAHPGFAASVLRCLGRQPHPGTSSWRSKLVRDGLALDAVEIRDAAVQAAESWGGLDMQSILKSHFEPEPWLRNYIRDVIDDLG